MATNGGWDIEKIGEDEHLRNDSLQFFTWKDINVTVQDRRSKSSKFLLKDVGGQVRAGELLALMGPSGSGKTTLLNVLARRAIGRSKVTGEMTTDGITLPQAAFRRISSYVEQEDSLIGSLTVRETIDFSAQLALPSTVTKKDRISRIENLLHAFGLVDQAETLIGTPLRKGISGGQKRRVSVAAQAITGPKILFLDEPTSGLDSTASHEVISFLRNVAHRYNLPIIASIHQPSTLTFGLFDRLLLLSQGQTCYFGAVSEVTSYFDSAGFPMPEQMNPAEFLLHLTNADFSRSHDQGEVSLDKIFSVWKERSTPLQSYTDSSSLERSQTEDCARPSAMKITTILVKRLFIKSYRDVVAYHVRIAMYIGLAIMMGTVWLRLPATQESIQPFINAIFFGSAFMSFMAVAYVPAYLEDRACYIKDRANGLYGPTEFLLANFLVGVPYLFTITLLFSVIAYWLSNFRPDGTAFMTWIMWLFLDLLAAESLVVLVSSLFPVFVLALATVAFANGLWMSVGGFLVAPTILNGFWKYVFHYIDYQAYVFQGMMVNEFSQRVYSCGDGCQCMYKSELEPQCDIAGSAVLQAYGYASHDTGKWAGILCGIILGYRILVWLALRFRE